MKIYKKVSKEQFAGKESVKSAAYTDERVARQECTSMEKDVIMGSCGGF